MQTELASSVYYKYMFTDLFLCWQNGGTVTRLELASSVYYKYMFTDLFLRWQNGGTVTTLELASSVYYKYMFTDLFGTRSNNARCSSVVERLFMVRLVVGSVPHGGPIELFLVPSIAARLV